MSAQNPSFPTPEDLFHQARAIPSEPDRAAFLTQTCGDNTDLRAKVEALLKADANVGGFLATKNKSTIPAAPLERPGQIIGRYKLLQLIGEGGFGSVYLAEQSEPVRRRIALKIIKPGMDSRMVAARFEAERQALALMDHPHIARVLDGGVTDAALGARPYFVMEYVIGDPITNFADAHKLSLTDRLNLFTQVCEAVQHAHTKGIIHRDLKPTNILVSMTDGKPFAKVIDFGIAKATGAAGGRLTDKTLFTEHRQLIGTPEYMSPEQAEGSPDIDTRTDVYALGVLLYELLTGATPFDAARLRSAAFAEMQRIIKEEDPPAPSVRLSRNLNILAATAAARQVEPAKLGTQVKGELDWIVMKALDKDRARRYESPNQFVADVRRQLAGEAVLAAPPGLGYRVRKLIKRNKGAVTIGVAVSAAILFGVAGLAYGLAEGRQALRREAITREDSEYESYRGRIVDAQFAVTAGRWPTARRRLEECPEPRRGWEWQFLNRATPDGLIKLPGHFRSAEINPSGDLVLTTAESVAKLWPVSGAKSPLLLTHNAEINSGVFSPDGSRVLTASQDTTAIVWDSVGELLITLKHDGPVLGAAFSRDGKSIISRTEKEVHLWDAAGRSIGSPIPISGSFLSMELCADASRVLLATSDSVRLFDGLGRPIGEPIRLPTPVKGTALNASGTRILVWDDGSVRLCDGSSRPIGQDLIHEAKSPIAQFSPDGYRILTCAATVLRLWDSDGKPVCEDFQWKGVVSSSPSVPTALALCGGRALTSAC